MKGDQKTAVQMRRAGLVQRVEDVKHKRQGIFGDPRGMGYEGDEPIMESYEEAMARARVGQFDEQQSEEIYANQSEWDQQSEVIYANQGALAQQNNPEAGYGLEEPEYEVVRPYKHDNRTPSEIERDKDVVAAAEEFVDICKGFKTLMDFDLTVAANHSLRTVKYNGKEIKKISNGTLPSWVPPERYEAMATKGHMFVEDNERNDVLYINTLLKSGKIGFCSTQNDQNLDRICECAGINISDAEYRVWAACDGIGKEHYMDHLQRCMGDVGPILLIDDRGLNRSPSSNKHTVVIDPTKDDKNEVSVKLQQLKNMRNVFVIQTPSSGGAISALSKPENLAALREQLDSIRASGVLEEIAKETKARYEKDIQNEAFMKNQGKRLYLNFINSKIMPNEDSEGSGHTSEEAIEECRSKIWERVKAQTLCEFDRSRDDIKFVIGGCRKPRCDLIKKDPRYALPEFGVKHQAASANASASSERYENWEVKNREAKSRAAKAPNKVGR